jgi:hypothetical protein
MKKIIVLTISIIPLAIGFLAGFLSWLILLAWHAVIEGYQKGRSL